MSSILQSSVGRKILMGVTGIFLMLFLVIHLAVNSLLMFDSTGELFNRGAHFMATNPMIRIIEPILGLSFLLHIMYGVILSIRNMSARPVAYNKMDQSKASTWSSRNMFLLGGWIFAFLVIHLVNFYFKLKFGEVPDVTYGAGSESVTMHDSYTLVAGLFKAYWWYDVIYIIGGVLLGLHLYHGFGSSLQTMGLNAGPQLKLYERIGLVYSLIIGGGFAIIPLYYLIFS